MSKKPLVYCLCCTESLVFSAANVALSLNKYMPQDEFEVVVYHDGLSKNNIDAINKIPKCKSKMLVFPEWFHRALSDDLPVGKLNNQNIILEFASFEIFELLHEYRTAIWITLDAAIQSDISDLTRFGPLGLSKGLNENKIARFKGQLGEISTLETHYDMGETVFTNALVVVNDKLPDWEKLKSYCYDKVISHAKGLPSPGQVVWSMMLQEFKIEPKEIPRYEYICPAQHEYAALAKIVHFVGKDKVWNDDRFLRSFPEWFRTHLHWLELGGGDFDRTWMSTRSIWSEIYGKPSGGCINIEVDQEARLFNRNEDLQSTFYLFGVPYLFTCLSANNEIKISFLGIDIIRFYRDRYRHILYFLNRFEIFKRKLDRQGQWAKIYVLGILIMKISYEKCRKL